MENKKPTPTTVPLEWPEIYILKHYWIEMTKDEKRQLMKRTGIKSYTTMLKMLDNPFEMRLCQLTSAHEYIKELTGEDVNVTEMWSTISSEIPKK